MMRVRLVAAALVAGLAGLAGLAAAPVPKAGAKTDGTPDVKALLAAVGKAVEAGKWPGKADEKALRETVAAVFERATTAAGQKGRKLPVEFDGLIPADVVREFRGAKADGDFVIAGEVEAPAARDSVVLAAGNVRIARATNCVLVGRNVHANQADNCLVIAGDTIRATGADRKTRDEGSVLVAGRLVRVTGARGAVCHVVRPAFGQLFPGEKSADAGAPPVRLTTANAVVVLNAREHWKAATEKKCATVVPAEPVAK